MLVGSMREVLYVLLGLSLIIGGLILQLEIASLDTSAWNFTGSPLAIALTDWLGFFLMVIGSGAMAILAMER